MRSHFIIQLHSHLLLVASFLLVSKAAEIPLIDFAVYLDDPQFAMWVRNWRRELHSFPELGYAEHRTAAKLQTALKETNISFETHASTGFVAVLGKGDAAQGPTVALRADMDALPISEDTGLPFASKIVNVMHACGHDAHMAMLLGAAKILKTLEHTLPGTVRLIFQPAEEGRGGGKAMVESGALGSANAVFALHVDPALPVGTVKTRAGPMMAASDRFTAKIVGVGGHGAAPHLTRDPIVAAASAVLALQAIVSRETDPLEGAVVSIGRLQSSGSGAPNVIPSEVELVGTVRAFDRGQAEMLRLRVEEVISGAARMHDCTAELAWSEVPYPSVVNNHEAVKVVLTAGAHVVGQHAIGVFERPYMYAEDFAFMAEKVPGALVFLGVRNETADPPSIYGLHHPKFTIDEAALPVGAVLHVAIALESLKQQAAAAGAGTGVGSVDAKRDEL